MAFPKLDLPFFINDGGVVIIGFAVSINNGGVVNIGFAVSINDGGVVNIGLAISKVGFGIFRNRWSKIYLIIGIFYLKTDSDICSVISIINESRYSK